MIRLSILAIFLFNIFLSFSNRHAPIECHSCAELSEVNNELDFSNNCLLEPDEDDILLESGFHLSKKESYSSIYISHFYPMHFLSGLFRPPCNS